ncbi:hypothetical protein FHG66_20735 [Rubellimicrobium rubrum]|uniref:Uncharacterized protein n=1 Tax=Rubellimicrobium rubrum TaxID=2585369 RepID=A0A5C4MJJ8_9RHOB|nr:hypothetical protein [Rubellimicrobium rubrum]TNC44162.1 hypothetical protein FHG66_20735 [Rubellimicrobium rubrum]
MSRLPITLAFVLWPALSSAGADLTYGVALDGGRAASELRLTRCEAACSAQVLYTNRFLRGSAFTRQFLLDLDGIHVGITIIDGEGEAAERFSVTPPPGFFVEPAELFVEENSTGVITLYPSPMS